LSPAPFEEFTAQFDDIVSAPGEELISQLDASVSDPVEEAMGRVFRRRNLPVPFAPYEIDAEALQERALELYVRTGKLGEAFFNIIRRYF
jgi:hypothetical protein